MIAKLSSAEKKVLCEIVKRGLLGPEKDIAKSLRISPSTLNYIIRKLEKEKVISEYRYRVDYRYLGKNNIAWLFLSLGNRNVGVDSIMEKLLEIPVIRRVSFITGEYDLVAKVYSKDNAELFSIIQEIENMLRDVLKEVAVFNVSKRYIYHEIPVDEFSETKLDEKDVEIIKAIKLDPNIDMRGLAKKLGMHLNTVYKRWNSLIKRKVLLKKSAIINPEYWEDAGIGMRAFLLINSEKGSSDELAKNMLKYSEIHELDRIVFPYDIIALVRCRDVRHFYELHERLYGDKKISPLMLGTRSCVVLDERYKPSSKNQQI